MRNLLLAQAVLMWAVSFAFVLLSVCAWRVTKALTSLDGLHISILRRTVLVRQPLTTRRD